MELATKVRVKITLNPTLYYTILKFTSLFVVTLPTPELVIILPPLLLRLAAIFIPHASFSGASCSCPLSLGCREITSVPVVNVHPKQYKHNTGQGWQFLPGGGLFQVSSMLFSVWKKHFFQFLPDENGRN